MKPLYIDRGIYKIGVKHADGTGEPGGWESNESGMTILLADINGVDGNIDCDNASIMSIRQSYELLEQISERLNLPPAEDLPDIKNIARNMAKDGYKICEYCDSLECRMCILSEFE